MTINEVTKHKYKTLWVFLIIILMILIAGVLIWVVIPSVNESSDNEIVITEPPLVRSSQIAVTPQYPYPNINIGDGGLITKELCTPPCFWNITPGETSFAEVYQIIEDKEITESCESIGENGNFNDLYCGDGFLISFYKESDIVSNIFLRPTQEIKMKDIIHEWGPPDRVLTQLRELPNAWDYIYMWIFYDDILTRILLEIQDYEEGNDYYHVSETTIVDYIGYFDEESYKSDALYQHASPWQGYGEYFGEFFP
jgi:hypothetical protein